MNQEKKEGLSKDTLKKMLFGAALMSAIDGKFDVKERETCLKFLIENWLPGFGDVKQFFSDVLGEIKDLLKSGPELYENIDQIATELAMSLSEKDKERLIKLVESIMMADGRIVVRETDLLARFRKKIEDPNLINLDGLV